MILLGAAALWLGGCGAGPLATVSPETYTGLAIHGGVQGGQQPIAGSAVYLYAAGSSGYGSPASSLLNTASAGVSTDGNGNGYVATDANGNFNITGDYSCSTGQQVYMLAVGGNPGNLSTTITGYSIASNVATFTTTSNAYTAGQSVVVYGFSNSTFLNGITVQVLSAGLSSTQFEANLTHGDVAATTESGGAGINNPDITLMTALGSCSFLLANASTTFINLNELTTIASAYALSQFMTSPTHLGTSSTNSAGFTNAFAWVNNLVNVGTGTTPGAGQPLAGGGFAGIPSGLLIPVATINTLGNILASCINTDPATDTDCSKTFGYALSSASVTPANTLQAVLNIAQNPGNNVSNLYGQRSGFVQYSPVLAAAPNDWTMNAKITVGGTNSLPYQVAVDGNGNAWVADSGATASGVTKIAANGSAINIYTGTGISAPLGIAIDLNNNAWVTDTGSGAGGLSEISSSGAVSGPFTGGGLTSAGVPHGIAMDSSDNIWVAVTTAGSGATQSLNEFSSADGSLTKGTIDVSGISTTSQPYGVAVDASGFIWVTNVVGTSVSRLTASGSAVSGSPYTGNGIGGSTRTLAFDSTGNAWVANGATAGSVTELNSTGMNQTGSPFDPSSQLDDPFSIAVDGLNHIWVGSYGGTATTGCITELSNTGALLSPVCYGLGGYTATNVSSAATMGVIEPHGLAIDSSGNLWVGSGSSNTIELMIGVAAPVTTPLVLATKTSALGTRP